MKLKERPQVDPPLAGNFKSRHNVNDPVIVYFGTSGIFKNAKVIKVHFANYQQYYDVEVTWAHADFVPIAHEGHKFTARLYNLHPVHVFSPDDFEETHPEKTCQQCGGKNVVWSADNDLWNELMGGPNGIICPQCFEKIAEEKGVSIIFNAVR